MEFSPQNTTIPRFLSADTATIAARDLLKALKNLTPNTPFAKMNDTHHTMLIFLEVLFNIIPKVAEKQSTSRHNGRRQEVEMEPHQGHAQLTHQYPTSKQQHQATTTRVQTNKKPGRPPRVAPSEVPT